MKAALLHALILIQPVAAQERSKGYGGSEPVGQISTAFAGLDCAAINRLPNLAKMTVPLSDECALSIPSPDGRFTIRTIPSGDTATLNVLNNRSGKFTRLRAFEQPVALRWKPDSTAFMLNDGEASGQTSRFRYYKLSGTRWIESRRFDQSAQSLYLKRYRCNGGARSYANVSGMNWTSDGMMRGIVTEGIHSAGCVQPHKDHRVMLEVIGDPFSGKIHSAREVRRVD